MLVSFVSGSSTIKYLDSICSTFMMLLLKEFFIMLTFKIVMGNITQNKHGKYSNKFGEISITTLFTLRTLKIKCMSLLPNTKNTKKQITSHHSSNPTSISHSYKSITIFTCLNLLLCIKYFKI